MSVKWVKAQRVYGDPENVAILCQLRSAAFGVRCSFRGGKATSRFISDVASLASQLSTVQGKRGVTCNAREASKASKVQHV